MIKNGQEANETNFNAAFVSRTADTSTTGKLALQNTADANSGGTIANAQRAITETFDAVGIVSEGDATRKQYSSNNYVAQGDSHKTAIGKLDAQAKTQSTAAPNVSNATGTLPIANGGTGQTLKSSAYDALSPNTTEGDLEVRGAANTNRLAIGTTGQVLTTDTTVAGKVKWAAPANPNVSNASGVLSISNGGTSALSASTAFANLSPLTTKADLLVNNSRLPVGSDAQVLTADSTTTPGVKWAAPAAPNVSSATGTLPIANGGTGQTTSTAAYAALSPLTTKGDIVVNNARLPIGTDAQVLTADSTTTAGVKWAAASGANPNVSNATGTLAIANGGTGSTTQNFVDLTTAQTVGGAKTLSTNPIFSAMTAAGVVVNSATGQTSTVAQLPIAQGGTGQNTAVRAFNALSPATTAGDLIYSDGTNNAKLGIGSSGQYLVVTGGLPSWATVTPGAFQSYNATYSLSANQAVAANSVIKFNNKIIDNSTPYYSTTTGNYTCQVAGPHRVSIFATVSGSGSYAVVRKNGAVYAYLCLLTGSTGTGSISVPLVAGDTLSIYLDATAATVTGATSGLFSQATFERTSS